MVDIQLDLETLGTEPGDVVVSIGALVFYTHASLIPALPPVPPAPEQSFYRNIDIFSSLMAGLKIKDNTVEWWQKQSKDAQDALREAPISLMETVLAFEVWFNALDKNGNVNVWAKSPSFDCSVWEAACKAVGLSVPWNFRNLRDVRTAVAMGGIDEKQFAFPGVKHNALDDCRSQARAVQRAHNALVSAQSAPVPYLTPGTPGRNK